MKPKEEKEKAIDEIIKIIQKFQYNYELSEKYKREILDQDKIYDWQSMYIRDYLKTLFLIDKFLLLSIVQSYVILKLENKKKISISRDL